MSLSSGTMDWSEVCDCGVSWTNSFSPFDMYAGIDTRVALLGRTFLIILIYSTK